MKRCCNEKKMTTFRKSQKSNILTNKLRRMMKKIVHNFSSYNFFQEDINALSYGLDYHVPPDIDKNSILIEFELFFQNLLKDKSNIPKTEISKRKRDGDNEQN